jgi:hypothetical protein
MATDSKIILGLPNLPNDQLPKDLYDDFKTIYNALNNLASGVSTFAGVDAPPQDEWSQSGPSRTILTGNLTRLYVPASVALVAGQIVNLFDNAGTLSARLASAAAASTMAHGLVTDSVGPGGTASIQWLRSYVNSIGGMTLGTVYWLSPTPGAVQNVAPVAVGTIAQPIGLAIAPTEMIMDIPFFYKQN